MTLRRTDTRQDFSALEEVYQRFEQEGTYPIPDSPTEPPLKPPPNADKDPWWLGKEIAERITKFIALCGPAFQVEDLEQIYFATELASLNVFNAQDSPVSEARRNLARDAADKYFLDSLSKIPDPR